jgi:hypothetical protein
MVHRRGGKLRPTTPVKRAAGAAAHRQKFAGPLCREA